MRSANDLAASSICSFPLRSLGIRDRLSDLGMDSLIALELAGRSWLRLSDLRDEFLPRLALTPAQLANWCVLLDDLIPVGFR